MEDSSGWKIVNGPWPTAGGGWEVTYRNERLFIRSSAIYWRQGSEVGPLDLGGAGVFVWGPTTATSMGQECNL